MQRYAFIHVLTIVISALCALLLTPHSAQAGGYDTPILYSARHMGMGGTAVGYVNDPSALFHNPAGLAGSDKIRLLADFSLLLGGVTGSPSNSAEGTSIDSETTVAPLFLVGGSVPITEWLSAGLAVFPVASAGATYKYGARDDSTTLVFIEVSPGVAVKLPHGFRLGLGYRITYMSLDRTIADEGSMPFVDFSMSGFNFASFRAGLQWVGIDRGMATEREHFSFGFNYRHKTSVEISADEGIAYFLNATDLQSEFVLPSRFSLGVRGDYGRFGGAFDFEYGRNSQNHVSTITGRQGDIVLVKDPDPSDPNQAEAPASVFEWSDAVTLRFGAEARVLERGELALRLGYIFDGKTANELYPTAFGTPPAPTHSITAGCGYDAGDWQANVAYAYRFGSTTVSQADVDAAELNCAFCGNPGEYGMGLHGIYADFSVDF